MRKGLMNSLSLGLFGAIGLSLLFFCHGLWFEAANQAGLEEIATGSIEPTKLLSLGLSAPFALAIFVLLVVNTLVSVNSQAMQKPAWIVFPMLSFASMLIVGVVTSYVIPLANNWYVWLTITMYGGICGLSHNLLLSSLRLHESINSAVSSHKDKDLFAKSLELKHISLLATLQWVIWGCIIFVTAGIVTVLFNPLQVVPRTVLDTYVINTLLLTTWSLFGVLIGIVASLFGQMNRLRETIVKVATRARHS